MRRSACEEGIKGRERAGPRRKEGKKIAVEGAGEAQRARSRVT